MATSSPRSAAPRLRTRIGDYAAATRAYEAAAALADPELLPRIEAALARTHLRAGDLAAAEAHVDAALAGSSEPAWQAACLADRAVIRRRAGDRSGAAQAAAEAEAAAVAAGDTAAIGSARRMSGLVALDAGDARAAVAHLEAALEAATDDGDPSAAIAALTGLALATAAMGEIEGALERGEEAVAACRHDEAFEHLRRSVKAFSEFDGDAADPDPGVWMLWAS